MSQIPAKPLPPIDAASQEYWDRCALGELTVQQCNICGHQQHYPRLACTACQGRELSLVNVSGQGTIRSFSIIRRAVSAAFNDDVPYVVALVQLAEGPTMMSNIINCEPESLKIGQGVQVVFESRGDGVKIPQFEPLQ
ncbi:MAG: OB-fold domain-containing protein [Pseudomonadota bacterium]